MSIVHARQLAATVLLALAFVPRGAAQDEVVRSFDLLDNGDFAEPLPRFADEYGVVRVPWWVTTAGREQLEEHGGRPCLRTRGSERARQPVAAYAPLADGIVVTGEVLGHGRVVLADGEGRRAALEVEGAGAFTPFRWEGAAIAAALGGTPRPRLTLELRAAGDGTAARWRSLAVEVPLPVPARSALAREVTEELDWILRLWEERGGDRTGEPTAFLAQRFDVLTGAATTPIPGGFNTYSELVVAAADARPDAPGWVARRDATIEDVLSRAVHPKTGLPRAWDCATDEPVNDRFPEIAAHLGFLIDLAEGGPEPARARARALAERAGRTVLETALLPDGEVAAKMRSSDGAPNMGYSWLRKLDVPAQLARLAALTGDDAYRLAALEGLASFEYAHSWPGNWAEIDPGFDDIFGHFGARATTMWRACPEVESFRRLALSGYGTYAPLWRDALRLGGNVAADQVRCWRIFSEIAELEPDLAPEVAPLLAAAARSHFKGQQYADGTWGDVTVFRFDPQADLEVGDTLGVPQNLLMGLAFLHEERLVAAGGLPAEEVRAMFTAVLRSSREAYRRPFGYLPERVEHAGTNESIASIRLAVGLVAMLERL